MFAALWQSCKLLFQWAQYYFYLLDMFLLHGLFIKFVYYTYTTECLRWFLMCWIVLALRFYCCFLPFVSSWHSRAASHGIKWCEINNTVYPAVSFSLFTSWFHPLFFFFLVYPWLWYFTWRSLCHTSPELQVRNGRHSLLYIFCFAMN